MLKKLLANVLFCSISIVAFSQNFSVSGKAVDRSDGSPVASATVSLLYQKDSVTIKSTATRADGTFHFSNIAADSLIVMIESIGYQQYVSFINLHADKDLGAIKMNKQGKDLAVVTVIAKPAPVSNKVDTAQYSASQFKVNPDATTEDLIKKMPGITVAKDGTVTAQGETVKKVTIDGKDFFGDDASAALKNLPSEVVDKIQVFDRLSDQAQLTGVDDGNSVKAINVVTKSGVKNGQFGRVYAGMGTDERYQAGGNVSFFNGDRRLSFVGNFNNINQQNFASQDLLGVTSSSGRGGRGGGGGMMMGGFGGGNNFMVGQSNGISRTNAFGINYSNKWGEKVNLSGSYFFNNSKNINSSLINTQTFGKLKDIFSNETGGTTTFNTNHRINLRLEYRIDSNNALFIIPSLNFQNNNSDGFSTAKSFFGINDSLNTYVGKTNRESNGYNLRNNIMFRHNMPAKKGRNLMLGLNTTFNKNYSDSYLDAAYRFFNNGFVTDSIPNLYYDNATTGNTIGGTIAYSEPVGKFSAMMLEYNPSVSKNKADQQTFLYDNGKYSIFDTNLSNKFDNTVVTHNAGVSYRYNPNRDNMLMIGANYQYSNLKSDRIFPTSTNVNQSFSNILPRAMWRKKFNNYSNLRMFYMGRTDFPSVTQLQDVVNTSNALRVSMGNPSLKQSYGHNLMARYSYANTKTSKSFFANLFAQTMADYISNGIYVAASDSVLQNGIILKKGSQLTKPVNLNGYRNIRTMLTYSMPIKALKSNFYINTGAGYNRLPGLTNYLAINTDNVTYSAGLGLSSNISEYIDFNISYTANFNNAKTTYPTYSTKNNYVNQSAGLQLNLLDKKGWFIQNDVNNQTYNGLSAGLDQSYWLWNAAIGKKFLKNRVGELKLSVFDLLRQNQSLVRTITANYIEDAQYNVLQQYFMLTFTYSLKNFGKAKPSSNKEDGPGSPAGRPLGPMGGSGGGHGSMF